MALSNVFREPRREITEQLAGLMVFAGVLGVDLPFALWFQRETGLTPFVPGVIAGLICGFLGGVMSFLIFGLVMHAVGEGVCNALARRGLELRPKNRVR